ncbi:FAD-dependent oxidoreductase [Tissierella praeacuta]|uniref:FAD-dependent oxidoreductase n=1 Tax=Tissierella praeacuta TaxID=43131 RepID=UPI0028AA72CB|nr:FAD-dependent oxidoreductase [Tissierella praeacuta]
MKKKILCLLLSLAMIISMAGCSKGAEAKSYTKTVKGFGGDVTVTVTLKDGVITDVKAEGPNETEGIGSKAIEELPALIVKANSADIDGMSGATITSNAIKTAVKAALKEDKGETDEALSFKPGTYTGEAYGNTSTIVVDVTVSDTEITKVEIVEHGESPILFDAARDTVISEILDEQTLAVDTVSGATVSSKAIVTAVANALEKSDVDMGLLNVPKEKESITPKEITKTADVVVVGGGGAGLVAANAAAEEGATVIVLEKAPFLGGNLTVFGGIYNTPDEEAQAKMEMSDGIKASIEKEINTKPVNEEHAAAIAAVKSDYEKWKANGSVGLFDSAAWFSLQTWNSGDKVARKSLVDIMCNNAYEGLVWLKNIGVEFSEKITQGAGSLYQRTHGAIKPNGSGFIDGYVDALKEYGDKVIILTETPVESLIMDGDKAVGVKATDKYGNNYTINANNGVILATGGFAGNVKLRQEYCEGEKWKDLSEKVLTTNLKAITGDGIIMARDIGVNLIDMDQIQLLHLGNSFTGSTKGVIPYKGRNSDEVIFVNSNGQRFVAEDGRRDVMCNAILQQDGGFYWMIHDSKNIEPYGDIAENYMKGNYLYRAETLEELADMVGVPKENLVASVNQYNEAVEKGVDELTGRKLLVATINEGPYFAAKRVPSAHHTMGGVEIDGDAHVYYENGNIVKGLYAAGEVCGGIHGGNRVGGNAVVDTVVFGRIAGINAANKK